MTSQMYLLIASMINIIVISALIYKKKYNWAWALAIIQALALIGLQ